MKRAPPSSTQGKYRAFTKDYKRKRETMNIEKLDAMQVPSRYQMKVSEIVTLRDIAYEDVDGFWYAIDYAFKYGWQKANNMRRNEARKAKERA